MPEDKATIGEFVEENDKLLAVLGIFLGVAAFKINRLAINIAAIKPTLIQCLVRMVVVLGWDESN